MLTISAGAVAQLMTSNATSSNRERQGVQAFSGGEAGLDVAANWVVTNDAGSVKAVNTQQTGSTTIAGNNVNWLATKVSSGQWKVTSTTVSPNGKVTKVLQEQLQSTAGARLARNVLGLRPRSRRAAGPGRLQPVSDLRVRPRA